MAYSLLPKTIDDAGAELRLARANSKEGLNRVIGGGGDLRVDAVTGILDSDIGSANAVHMKCRGL